MMDCGISIHMMNKHPEYKEIISYLHKFRESTMELLTNFLDKNTISNIMGYLQT
jgi:hypothetical protein